MLGLKNQKRRNKPIVYAAENYIAHCNHLLSKQNAFIFFEIMIGFYISYLSISLYHIAKNMSIIFIIILIMPDSVIYTP